VYVQQNSNRFPEKFLTAFRSGAAEEGWGE